LSSKKSAAALSGGVSKTSVAPGFPVLLEARVAVHWLAFGWLERNFAFLSTVSAHCLVHFAVAIVAFAVPAVVGAVLVVIHFFTCF